MRPAHRFVLPAVLALLLIGPAPGRELRGEGKPARTDRYGDPLPAGARLRLGRALRRGSVPVWSVAFSPDGHTLASAQGRTVRLWEVATGKELRPLAGHPAIVVSLAFSPDGKMLASLGSNTVCVWETATGRLVRQAQDFSLGKDHSTFNALAFSPDGKALATGGFDKVVRLWDVATLAEIRRCRGHESPIRQVAFSRDGRVLVSAGDGQTIRLWESATGKELRRFREPPEGDSFHRALALSPDGKTIAARCGPSAFHLLDVATGERLRRFEGDQQVINWLDFSPDGRTLASGSLSPWFSLWDVTTGKELRRFEGHRGPVAVVSFSPDGTRAASGSWDETIRLWDLATGKPLHEFPGALGKTASVAVSPDGRTLASAGKEDRFVRLWDGITGEPLRTLSTGNPLEGSVLAFSPDGRTLASAGWLSPLRLWDVATGKELSRFRPGEGEAWLRFAFSPDGQTLAAAGQDGMISLLKVATAEKVHELRWYRRTKAEEDDGLDPLPLLAFSPEGSTLAVAGQNVPALGLWEVAGRLRQFRVPADAGGWNCGAFSPDGKTLATLGYDRGRNRTTVSLWETATGQQRLWLGGPADQFTSMTFSPDGKTVVTGDGDGSIRFWDVWTGKEVGRLHGHEGDVSAVAFYPDGKRLVSGSADTSLLVWEVPEGIRKRRPESVDLSAREREALWADLARDDAVRAYQAIATLSKAPESAVSLLRARLRPAEEARREERQRRIQALIARLDDDDFRVREDATRELGRLGDLAEPALRKVLAGRPSAETRRRAEQLLGRLAVMRAPSPPDLLRALRAVEVLERVGTPEASRVLESLAGGAPEARLTQEAGAARKRLGLRAVPKP